MMQPPRQALMITFTTLTAIIMTDTFVAASSSNYTSTTPTTTSTTSTTSTTTPYYYSYSSTYYWERCTTGKGSGPPGYIRLCDGDDHGECLGKIIGVMSSQDNHDCGDECSDTQGCGGFEYDLGGGSASCKLFGNVTGVNRTKASHLNTHECYQKEPPKVGKCTNKIMFAGRYERLCDGQDHGECQGTDLGPILLRNSANLCAAECDRNATCAGFEYDVHDVSLHCYLYRHVRGAEKPDFTHTHECYAKVNFVTSGSSMTTTMKATTTIPTSNRTTTTTTKPTETATDMAVKLSVEFCVGMISTIMIMTN
jgi:hypothetical protein